MKFKTNAKCGGCVAAIGAKLDTFLKANEWRIDLESVDRVLYVMADVSAEKVMIAVKEAGFVIEKIE